MKVREQTLGQEERWRHREGMEEMANKNGKLKKAYYRAKTVPTVPSGEQTHLSFLLLPQSLSGCSFFTAAFAPTSPLQFDLLSSKWIDGGYQQHGNRMNYMWCWKYPRYPKGSCKRTNMKRRICVWRKCSLTLASLSPVGQSAGTIFKTLLVFCALKKKKNKKKKKAMLSLREKELYKKKKNYEWLH